MPLSEHVYCVTITFEMTEQVEQRICIKFCVKLEHSSMETIRVIQKATAMGKWWLAASPWQHTHSCIAFCAEFFGKTSNHPGDSVLLQPRFGYLWLLAFPQTKVTFESEEISAHWWDSGKIWWSSWWRLELCEVPRSYFEGDWGITVLCTTFLEFCLFFNNCLYVSYYMAGYLLDGLHEYVSNIAWGILILIF